MAWIVAAAVTLPEPSKEADVQTTSPVIPIVRPVAKAVAVAALPVALPALPDTLPVTFPVKAPTKVVVVSAAVPALYVIPASVLGAKSPVALSNKATNDVVSVVSATVIVAGTILAVPSKEVPPMVLAFAKARAV